jgi:pimeloyl-ACP methyl ester carboxylesterase
MKRIGVALAAALLIGLGAVGWIYSDQILGPDRPPGTTGQRVLAHTDSTITLASTLKARRPGHWAISWPGGFGRIGPLIAVEPDRVITRFAIASGTPPNATSRLAGFAPDADPLTWLGVEFENVSIPARVGSLPAWWIPGRDSTWALFVHGRAATRAEVLRMLPPYRTLAMPCLILAYRNDAGAPQIDGGRFRLGMTEWQDLEDAVRYAKARGARDVVVVGCSMGGGIVAQYLRRSSERAFARAAVLDAPTLDWNAVLAQAARERHVPGAITELGKTVASLRSGLRWSELAQAPHASSFSTPMLVLHGDKDDVVPIAVSEEFARARPDLVTFRPFAGAGHVESANVDADGYAATIIAWLRERGLGAPSQGEPARQRPDRRR